jgi:hypothetical protein
MTDVRAMLVLTTFVPPFFARKAAGNADMCRGKPHLKLPSEGRGHRFESCRVRHFPS